MGSTVSPDGRFLAATSTDKSVALQIFDLSSYKLDLDGRHRIRGQPEAHRRHRRSGRPDVLAGRQVPLASGAERPDPVPGQRRRHARHADHRLDPDGERPLRPGGPDQVLARRVHRCTPRSTDRTPSWRSTPAPVRSSRRGTSASPRVSSPSSASKLYVSNEGGRQAQAGETTMDSYGTQVPANGYLGTSTTGTVSVIDTANPSAAVGSIAVGLHPTAMYRKRQRAVRRQHEQTTPSRSSTRTRPGRADDRDQAVAVVGRRVRSPTASR